LVYCLSIPPRIYLDTAGWPSFVYTLYTGSHGRFQGSNGL